MLRHLYGQFCFALLLLWKGVAIRLGGATAIWVPHGVSKQTGSEGAELRNTLVVSWEAGIKLCPKPRNIHLWIFS